MYDSIQLTKTASSHTTSQVTWPNDNKAVGNCFHALIAGLRPARLILAPADRVSAGFDRCWAGAAYNLARVRAGPGLPRATSTPHAIVTRRRCCPTATCSWLEEVRLRLRPLSRERGTLRSGQRDLEWHGRPQHRTQFSHGDVAAQRQGARRWRRSTTAFASAELYDPASGTWTATGSLDTARVWSHGDLAAQRQGAGGQGDMAAAAISRARNSTIRRAGPGPPPAASAPHAVFDTATLLPNGKVLVAGGSVSSTVYLASAELYDPASGTWSATGSLGTARASGTRRPCCPTAWCWWLIERGSLYDPASGTWTATGSLGTARVFPHGDLAA